MSRVENWAKPGMPPEEYVVLDKVYVFRPDTVSYEIRSFLKGELPHLGTVIQNGYTGTETYVEFNCYPGIEPRLEKHQRDVERSHPLYEILKQRHSARTEELPIFNG